MVVVNEEHFDESSIASKGRVLVAFKPKAPDQVDYVILRLPMGVCFGNKPVVNGLPVGTWKW